MRWHVNLLPSRCGKVNSLADHALARLHRGHQLTFLHVTATSAENYIVPPLYYYSLTEGDLLMEFGFEPGNFSFSAPCQLPFPCRLR